MRALLDAGEVRLGRRGLEGLQSATTYAEKFAGVTEKSSYNLFTQNPWYVGKLAGAGRLPSLKQLIDHQQEFITAFEGIVQRPREQEDVLREMVTRCLSAAA